ncbi:MAG: M20/M25/M40 family metallo-hydrolase [Phycisphaerae bacterium]
MSSEFPSSRTSADFSSRSIAIACCRALMAGGLAWSPSALAGGDADLATLFNAEAYIEHVRYLASDELEGRGTGFPGNDRASEYIAEQWGALGLKAMGVDGTWFQPFEVKRGKKVVDANAVLEAGEVSDPPTPATKVFTLRTDWMPFPFTATSEAAGEVVFVGYGIESSEPEYSDYAGVDVTGKLVLMFRYEPQTAEGKSRFADAETSDHALFLTKVALAAKKGAKGVLVVNPPNRKDADDKLYPFNEQRARETYELPAAHLTQSAANELLKLGGLSEVGELQKLIDDAFKPRSAPLAKLNVRLNPGVEQQVLKTRNVVGMIEGDGSTDEIIVVGAHFDHLGIATRSFRGGGDGEKFIHNGADDNASGTAGILELARALSHGPKHRRHILFIAFSGEEMGLLGSKHYVDHPTVDLAKVRAMINFDMIGRFNADRFLIYGIPTADEFEPIVKRAAERAGITYRTARSLPGNSDHASFQRKKIPVLFPFTGIHRQYHQPEDDWELINANGAVEILQFGYVIIDAVADLAEGPTWNEARRDEPESPAERGEVRPGDADTPKPPDGDKSQDAAKPGDAPRSADAPDRAPDRAPPGDDARPAMPTVRLGVIPDYAAEGPGLRLEGARSGSLADKAGIQEGDRILKINDAEVRGVESYMAAMGKVKRGDVITLELDRKGEKITVKIDTSSAEPPGRGRQ